VPAARASSSRAARPPSHLRRLRIELGDGAQTTVHVATYDAAATDVRVAVLRGQARLAGHCARRGIAEALVGGFFVRPAGLPLGEVRTRGVLRRHVPFLAPHAAGRACVAVQGGVVRIAPRDELAAAPRGDLLQAGPLLVRDGAPVYDRALDPEGFSAGAAQFDSDITLGRHPRAALGIGAGGELLSVACDGRSRDDAGLTLEELAALMAGLGAAHALNLDGGGSTSLVAGGRLCNAPRGGYERPSPAAARSPPRCCSCRAPEAGAGAGGAGPATSAPAWPEGPQRRRVKEGGGGASVAGPTARTAVLDPDPDPRDTTSAGSGPHAVPDPDLDSRGQPSSGSDPTRGFPPSHPLARLRCEARGGGAGRCPVRRPDPEARPQGPAGARERRSGHRLRAGWATFTSCSPCLHAPGPVSSWACSSSRAAARPTSPATSPPPSRRRAGTPPS
jgi:hypothetical protein